jgi:hypothetical protein
MAWTSDSDEPLKDAKKDVENAIKLAEQKNWEWAISCLENAVENLFMAQGACEYQMQAEKEEGTFVSQDEPDWL